MGNVYFYNTIINVYHLNLQLKTLNLLQIFQVISYGFK